MKTLEEAFKDNLSFINKYDEIINGHLVDFISENLWEKCLPRNLRVDLEKSEKLVFSELLANSQQLNKIMKEINSLNLRNNTEILDLKDLSKFLCNENSRCEEKNFGKEIQNDFMKDKKRYEVSVLSSVIRQLAEDRETLVIDAGGGKGYLATHLSEKYNIPVLSIDSNPSRHRSAVDRQELIEKQKHRPLSLVQHTVKFIDSSTDYVELAKEHFPNWSGENYLLTGLHTCGSLAHAVIRAFTNSPALKILCVVSCCYHLADEFLTTDFVLSKSARMLAQQSVERISAKNEEHSPSLFYRALLQVLLQSLGLPDAKIGRGAPTDDFPTYAKWALKKIGLDSNKMPTDEDLGNLQNAHSVYQWRINTFQTLRAHMGSVVESSLILDRAVYLQRSEKCVRLGVVRLFDPLLSPRCYAIIALK